MWTQEKTMKKRRLQFRRAMMTMFTGKSKKWKEMEKGMVNNRKMKNREMKINKIN